MTDSILKNYKILSFKESIGAHISLNQGEPSKGLMQMNYSGFGEGIIPISGIQIYKFEELFFDGIQGAASESYMPCTSDHNLRTKSEKKHNRAQKRCFLQKTFQKSGTLQLYSNERKSPLKIFSRTVTLYIGTETNVSSQKLLK